ncbi:MAG: c-type cytochrome [bacterium]|nr:c-type cytochrome [bacterium]
MSDRIQLRCAPSHRTLGRLIAAGALSAALLAGSGAASAADDELKNLTVFPKDISKRELVDTMKQWTQALGVRCDFCHEQKVPGDFQSIDFASDKVGHKEVARRMYTMVRDLNGGPLPKAAGEDDAAVNCFTCHRGLPSPTTLERVVLRATREKGAEGGVQKYRELRERYYGSGSFDFSPGTLQSVTETLAAETATLDAALAMARLNLEMNPKFADGHVAVAQILEMKQDKAGALTAVEEALKLDPNHRHAQRLKQKLTK